MDLMFPFSRVYAGTQNKSHHKHTHVHIYTHVFPHTLTHTPPRVRTLTHKHIDKHNTYTHVHTHTCTLTHTYTCIHTYTQPPHSTLTFLSSFSNTVRLVSGPEKVITRRPREDEPQVPRVHLDLAHGGPRRSHPETRWVRTRVSSCLRSSPTPTLLLINRERRHNFPCDDKVEGFPYSSQTDWGRKTSSFFLQ